MPTSGKRVHHSGFNVLKVRGQKSANKEMASISVGQMKSRARKYKILNEIDILTE